MSAVAAISTSQPNIDFTAQSFIAFGTIALSGNYGTASSHGDTVDLSVLGVPSSYAPVFVTIAESATPGTSQSGWVYEFNLGTTQKNCVMQVFGSGTSGQGLAELSQGSAYSSATPAIPSKVYFLAIFAKL